MSTALLPLVLALTPLGADPPPSGSSVEAWTRVGACQAALSAPEEAYSWERVTACESAVGDVLRLGDDGDRERLWDLYEQDSTPLRSLALHGLLDSYVAEAVSGLADDAPPTAPLVPLSQGLELPEGLENASADLRGAIELFEDLRRRGWGEGTASDVERIPFTSADGRMQFEGVVSEFLRGRSGVADTRAALDRFEYGLGCGNGAVEFFQTLAAVRLVASLREGRVDPEAVAAYVTSPGRGGEEPDGSDRRLLRAAGIDWEALFVGALASRRGMHVAPLVRAGSDRAARLLLELVDLVGAEASQRADVRRLLLPPMAAFVSAQGPCEGYGSTSSNDYERDADAPSIDPSLQDAVLERLEQSVQPGAGLDEAEAASHALLRLCRADSVGAFAVMFRSPYSQVRERGALALRAWGEAVPDPRPVAPVAFRLLVDGRPWESGVTWALEGQGTRMSSATPDREGIVRLDRDPFLDPTDPIEAVRLSSDEFTTADGTWFSLRFKPPADLDVRTVLTVETGSLTVVVPPAAGRPTAGRHGASLMLFAATEDGPESIASLPVQAGRYVFPRLQHGAYFALLSVPEGAALESPEVEVGARPTVVEVAPVASRASDPADLEAGDLQPEP